MLSPQLISLGSAASASTASPQAPGATTVAVDGISPSSGPTSGGTDVTITGTGFTNVDAVTFGGVEAESATVVSSTLITALAPAHAAGTVDIIVGTAAGNSAAAAADQYTFAAAAASPVVSGVSPSSGPASGGTTVTVTGSGFTGASGVTFDGIPATND